MKPNYKSVNSNMRRRGDDRFFTRIDELDEMRRSKFTVYYWDDFVTS